MRTILFDWDGTIVDSIGALYETDAAICRQIGVPFDLEIFRRHFSPNWRRMYDSLGIPKDRTEEAVQVWRETFRGDRTEPFDGVHVALARLATCGFTLGLVTSGDRTEVEPQLNRVGVDHLMTVRVYGNDTSNGKPNPEPLLRALELAEGCDPADAVYVGDALDDMRMASATGVRGVGIVSILATSDDLAAAGAFETAASIPEWVDRYLGGTTAGRAISPARALDGQP